MLRNGKLKEKLDAAGVANDLGNEEYEEE